MKDNTQNFIYQGIKSIISGITESKIKNKRCIFWKLPQEPQDFLIISIIENITIISENIYYTIDKDKNINQIDRKTKHFKNKVILISEFKLKIYSKKDSENLIILLSNNEFNTVLNNENDCEDLILFKNENFNSFKKIPTIQTISDQLNNISDILKNFPETYTTLQSNEKKEIEENINTMKHTTDTEIEIRENIKKRKLDEIEVEENNNNKKRKLDEELSPFLMKPTHSRCRKDNNQIHQCTKDHNIKYYNIPQPDLLPLNTNFNNDNTFQPYNDQFVQQGDKFKKLIKNHENYGEQHLNQIGFKVYDNSENILKSMNNIKNITTEIKLINDNNIQKSICQFYLNDKLLKTRISLEDNFVYILDDDELLAVFVSNGLTPILKSPYYFMEKQINFQNQKSLNELGEEKDYELFTTQNQIINYIESELLTHNKRINEKFKNLPISKDNNVNENKILNLESELKLLKLENEKFKEQIVDLKFLTNKLNEDLSKMKSHNHFDYLSIPKNNVPNHTPYSPKIQTFNLPITKQQNNQSPKSTVTQPKQGKLEQDKLINTFNIRLEKKPPPKKSTKKSNQ